MAKGKKVDLHPPEFDDAGELVEHVWIKRPIQKDGMLDGGGWEEKFVPKVPAMEQLALPKELRNAHWKNAQLIDKPKEQNQVA